MCLARFGSPATACVDQAEDLSPQSSPFRDAWIGKNVRNKRVSDRVLFPSPAPLSSSLQADPSSKQAPFLRPCVEVCAGVRTENRGDITIGSDQHALTFAQTISAVEVLPLISQLAVRADVMNAQSRSRS